MMVSIFLPEHRHIAGSHNSTPISWACYIWALKQKRAEPPSTLPSRLEVFSGYGTRLLNSSMASIMSG